MALWCNPQFNILPMDVTQNISDYELMLIVVRKLNEMGKTIQELPYYIQQMIQNYITTGVLDEALRGVLSNIILNVKKPPVGIEPAVGDGSKNDGKTIQDCINYVSSNGGGFVYFPPGTYLTSQIQLVSNVSLIGFNKYETKLVLAGGNDMALIQGNVTNSCIYNMFLDGNAPVQSGDANIIDLVGNHIHLYNLVLTDGYTLINLTKNGPACEIENIEFIYGIEFFMYISGANDSMYSNNLKFGTLSSTNGIAGIYTSSNNDIYENILAPNTLPLLARILGDNNVFTGKAKTTAVDNNGTTNSFDFYSDFYSKYYKNNSEENLTGTKSINAAGFNINTTNPIGYKKPTGNDTYFNKIPFKNGNSPYNVAVLNNQITNNDYRTFLPLLYLPTPTGGNMQGGCTDGTYLYFAHVISDTTATYLYKINIETGQIAITQNSLVLNHANDMCCYNGELYITARNKIIVVSQSNLLKSREINLNFECNSLDYYNGNFYCLSGSTMNICDLNFNVKSSFNIPSLYTAQGMAIFNDSIYLLNLVQNQNFLGSTLICRYDLNGKLFETYGVPGCGSTLEGEFILNYNGNILIGMASWVPAESNLLTLLNENNNTPILGAFQTSTMNAQEISLYVNESYNGCICTGTEEQPFKRFGDAIKYISNFKLSRPASITLLSNVTSTVTIQGVSGFSIIVNGGNFSFEDIRVMYGAISLKISNARFKSLVRVENSYFWALNCTFVTATIQAKNATMRLEDCTFNADLNTNDNYGVQGLKLIFGGDMGTPLIGTEIPFYGVELFMTTSILQKYANLKKTSIGNFSGRSSINFSSNTLVANTSGTTGLLLNNCVLPGIEVRVNDPQQIHSDITSLTLRVLNGPAAVRVSQVGIGLTSDGSAVLCFRSYSTSAHVWTNWTYSKLTTTL